MNDTKTVLKYKNCDCYAIPLHNQM